MLFRARVSAIERPGALLVAAKVVADVGGNIVDTEILGTGAPFSSATASGVTDAGIEHPSPARHAQGSAPGRRWILKAHRRLNKPALEKLDR